MTEVFHGFIYKDKFAYFQLDGGFCKGIEYFIDVGDVFLDGAVIYSDIFKIYQTVLPV